MFGRPTEIPSAAQALPGRDEMMQLNSPHLVLGTSMLMPFPDDCDQIVLGLGCFWGAERKFWNLPGVYTTAVGYAAGHTPNPSYEEVCSGLTGHAEVVRVVFDPRQTSYDAMLKIFWENHDPTHEMRQGNDVGTQYRSGIYWTGEAQRHAAVASRQAYQHELTQRDHGTIATEYEYDFRNRSMAPVINQNGGRSHEYA